MGRRSGPGLGGLQEGRTQVTRQCWEKGSERRKVEGVPREGGRKEGGSQEDQRVDGRVLGGGMGTEGSLQRWSFLRGRG